MPVPNVNFVNNQQALAQQYQSSKQKEIHKLSDHADLANLHYAGKRVKMKPALVEPCPRITSPFVWKHLISPLGTVTLQSFPHNYKFLMLCNLARQNHGCYDSLLTLADKASFLWLQ